MADDEPRVVLAVDYGYGDTANLIKLIRRGEDAIEILETHPITFPEAFPVMAQIIGPDREWRREYQAEPVPFDPEPTALERYEAHRLKWRNRKRRR